MRPLRVGLNMSRAHYEMELQRTMAGHKGKVKGDSMLSVAVGDEQLPHMTSESQIQVRTCNQTPASPPVAFLNMMFN